MAFTVNRIDHVVLNCRDVDDHQRLVRAGARHAPRGLRRQAGWRCAFGNQKINVRPSGAPNWVTGAVDAPGSLDLCFIAEISPDDVGAHLRACGVTITEGPVTKTGALGPMTSHYCRDPDGNLIEVASYSAPGLA